MTIYKLKARNSSQNMDLHVTPEYKYEELYITITGKYEGKDIQIDFDSMKRKDVEKLHKYLGIVLKVFEKKEGENE